MRVKRWDNAKTRSEVEALNIPDTLLNGYNKMKIDRNSVIDLSEPIYESSINKIVSVLKHNNIDKITISHQSENLLDILAIFEDNGCQIGELTKINQYHTNKLVNAVSVKVG